MNSNKSLRNTGFTQFSQSHITCNAIALFSLNWKPYHGTLEL